MAAIKYTATMDSATTLLSTELNSLATGSTTSLSSAYDNDGSGKHWTHANFELYIDFTSAPTAGKAVDLYIVGTVDGTNYGAVSNTNYVGSFAVLNSASAMRLFIYGVPIPSCDFKVALISNSGQTTESSGNTLKMQPYAYEVA